MITRGEMQKQLQQLDVESLVCYAQLLHLLQQEPEDEITKGLMNALIRILEKGQNIEEELKH